MKKESYGKTVNINGIMKRTCNQELEFYEYSARKNLLIIDECNDKKVREGRKLVVFGGRFSEPANFGLLASTHSIFCSSSAISMRSSSWSSTPSILSRH